MKIGIIGSGNVGGTLTRLLTKLGHDVSVANARGPQSLADLAAQTGAKAVSVEEAARGQEIVVIAIPQGQVMSLSKDLFKSVPDDIIVVDASNYYPRERDGRIEAIESSATESGWVSRTLGRPITKAFNNIFADDWEPLGKSAGTPGRVALPVAGDDANAKAAVMHLIDELGFDSVDAGGIGDSWRQQPGTPVYTANQDAVGTKSLLAQARPGRATEFCGTANSPGTWENPA